MSATGNLQRLQKVHDSVVLRRRKQVLARNLASVVPPFTSSLLDVGCGDGVIAAVVAELTPGMRVQGVEVLDREACAIPYELFDGQSLPFADGSFDCVSFVDVLHHTDDPATLIGEAARVSRRYVVLKDHIASNRYDRAVLTAMDWVGNRSYGVHLNYNYLPRDEWQEIFDEHNLDVVEWNQDLGLYPFPASMIFEHGKHFVALLEKPA